MKLFIPFVFLFCAVGASMSLWIISAEPPFPPPLPRALPHRPVTPLTNWGQGRNPGPACPPGTVHMTAEGLFLECMR